MPLPTKQCKYCGEKEPTHWPYQCRANPKRKGIKVSGRKSIEWLKFRSRYLKNHPANHEGYYTCYLCGRWISKAYVNLDHIIPRSRRPDLVFDESNIRLCCAECNADKGSKVY